MSDHESSPPPHHRSIRSFVIRAGRATVAQQRALQELWPQYGIEPNNEPLDIDAVFARSAPRMIEIGFGTGEALLAYAQAHPQENCIGIEVHPPGVGHLLLELHQAQMRNVRVICRDAVEVLQQQIAPRSIDAVHIFFPDPWPKKRHHKRRLIQPAFAELLATVIKPGGLLRLATDWQPYAEHMLEVLNACDAFANESADGYVERFAHRPLTRFERRGQRLGHGVWDLAYRRRE